MYRRRLVKNAKGLLEEMRKSAAGAYRSHDMESIHDLRLAYKKLRALLRMANGRAGIPSSVKDLYHAAGVLRNLQLYREALTGYFNGHNLSAGDHMLRLDNAILEAEQEFDRQYKTVSFGKFRRAMRQDLEHRLSHRRSAQWISDKDRNIRIQAASANTDEELHDLRKQVKDRMYTDDYSMAPEDYKTIAQLLGSYLDACVLLEMQDEFSAKAAAAELQLLLDASGRWNYEKLQWREELMKLLELFLQSPANDKSAKL